MTPRQVKEFAENKEADFAIGVPGIGRFRANVYQQRGTLAFAFRAIPYQVKTDPGAAPAAGARGDRAQAARPGAGHRRSPARASRTALAAMIQHINEHRRANVITIEDPIEFLHRDMQLPHQPARGRAPTR